MDNLMHSYKTVPNWDILKAQAIRKLVQGIDAWPLHHAHLSSSYKGALSPQPLFSKNMLQQQEGSRDVKLPPPQD
jgi:hypothetical protein